MTRLARRIVLTTAALALLFAAPAVAHAMVAPMTLQQLVDSSTVIVRVSTGAGHARAVGLDERARPEAIVTDTSLTAERAYKGSRPRHFTLTQPGGKAGGYGLLVSDTPKLAAGERAVLFLDEHGVVGGEQGCLRIVGGQVPALGISLMALEASIGQARRGGLSAADDPAARALKGAGVTPGSDIAAALSANTTYSTSSLAGITSISPARAASGVGQCVTITGTGFGTSAGRVCFPTGTAIDWLGTEAAVETWSDTSVVVVVPRNAQAGLVKLYTAGSGSPSAEYNYDLGFSFLGHHWAQKQVTYYINENTGDMTGEGAAIRRAMDTWNGSGADFTMLYGGSSQKATLTYDAYGNPVRNGQNDLFFTYGIGAGVLAVNYMWVEYEAQTDPGHFVESDLMINDAWTWGDGASATYFDVETIALHELGHTVGLGDQYANLERVMGAAVKGTPRRALTAYEVEGALYAYPAAASARMVLGSSAKLTPVYGKPAYVSVRLYDINGQALPTQTNVLLYQGDTAVATLVASVSDPGLYYGYAPLVKSRTDFTASWPGDGISPACSFSMVVKPKVKLTVNAPEKNRSRRKFAVKGTLAPAHGDASVVFEVWKKYSSRKGYFRYNNYTLLTSKGSFYRKLSLPKGSYRVRIKHGDLGHSDSASTYDYFKVR
ncbi:MAG TPA: IPT/TIG domain-containing protein [Coriobacteriia bacterium]|nr:IPT/TIG domain-containing protein [Coriobacteriia bacterium]